MTLSPAAKQLYEAIKALRVHEDGWRELSAVNDGKARRAQLDELERHRLMVRRVAMRLGSWRTFVRLHDSSAGEPAWASIEPVIAAEQPLFVPSDVVPPVIPTRMESQLLAEIEGLPVNEDGWRSLPPMPGVGEASMKAKWRRYNLVRALAAKGLIQWERGNRLREGRLRLRGPGLNRGRSGVGATEQSQAIGAA